MKTVDSVFENLKIVQDSEHLKYGTDALLLSAFAGGGKNLNAIDLGCGNGIISLCLLHSKKAGLVTGVEILQSSAELARESAEINGLSENFKVENRDFTEVPKELYGAFDYAVSNPPYMKVTSGKPCELDTKNAARHEAFCDVYSLCDSASKYVKFGGYFYVVYRPDRISDLFDALKKSKFEPKRICFVSARPELAPCLMLVEAKSNAATGCTLMPPFFISGSDGENTEQMKNIYAGGSL